MTTATRYLEGSSCRNSIATLRASRIRDGCTSSAAIEPETSKVSTTVGAARVDPVEHALRPCEADEQEGQAEQEQNNRKPREPLRRATHDVRQHCRLRPGGRSRRAPSLEDSVTDGRQRDDEEREQQVRHGEASSRIGPAQKPGERLKPVAFGRERDVRNPDGVEHPPQLSPLLLG